MDSQDIKKNICRICLDESVVLDWNATLYGYCDITYKDCYYKYTQMDCPVSDPFSSMLCQICLNGLFNVHTLILKALESHKFFQDTSNLVASHSTNLEDIKYTPAEFETVLMEKIEVEHNLQDDFIYKDSDDDVITKSEETKFVKKYKQCGTATIITAKPKNEKHKADKSSKVKEISTLVSTIRANDFEEPFKKLQRKARGRATKRMVDQHDAISKKVTLGKETTEDRIEKQTRAIGDHRFDCARVESKLIKKNKETKNPRMCSICSKILHNIYAVRMHEKTHMENRERKETCKICGLKFYDKRNLYSHKRIHKENREKVHKCEFCNKSFFEKGGLNIHRRIHLGQMVPCSLCTKQFFRQIDLERHMDSHSAAAINSDTKKRSRYFVRCKYCNKSILSTSFKSHTAAHLNEPLMKCSICGKEYFRRGSCVNHLKRAHKKTNEEYNDFIIQYKKNRISHLFLEQKADIQYTDE